MCIMRIHLNYTSSFISNGCHLFLEIIWSKIWGKKDFRCYFFKPSQKPVWIFLQNPLELNSNDQICIIAYFLTKEKKCIGMKYP